MTHPQNHLSAFDFTLPDSLIAQSPKEPRDHARLLHIAGAGLAHRHIYDLPELLKAGDVLVVNDSRVIPARLLGKRGEAKVELLLHRRQQNGTWEAFARPAKRLKVGDRIVMGDDFHAELIAHKNDGLVDVKLSSDDAAMLERYGRMPLPPYIKRAEAEENDKTRYQTVYANEAGSVAAPTAGLHFTPQLLAKIEAMGVTIARVTLHVGAGTFLPVKTDDLSQHVMHAEHATLDQTNADIINAAREKGGRAVAVGTTATRVLETVAAENGTLKPWSGETRIFITPGYRFKCVDVLLTNFHLPKSTLFMLVSAFAGLSTMKTAYETAIQAEYRFFSYGDACFIEKAEKP